MASRAAVGSVVVLLLTVLVCSALASVHTESSKLQYCSFFNNRAPSEQPGLKNCTWFKENSCCLQQEIEATFGRVKPLQGASRACQRYVNYLMCYICAPDQNLFYQGERLTVCEQFCDAWYDACGLAVLKGSVIRDLYSNGRQFCRSRRFKVARTDGCFNFDIALDTSGGHRSTRPRLAVVVALSIFCVLATRTQWPSSGLCSRTNCCDVQEAARCVLIDEDMTETDWLEAAVINYDDFTHKTASFSLPTGIAERFTL